MADRTRDPNGMALDGKQWSHVAASLRGSDVLMGGKPIRRSRKEGWAAEFRSNGAVEERQSWKL